MCRTRGWGCGRIADGLGIDAIPFRGGSGYLGEEGTPPMGQFLVD